jgi:cation transport protein ChaC
LTHPIAEPRTMRLTPELVAKTLDPHARTSNATFMTGRRKATQADFHKMARQLLNDAPDPGHVWVFTYGSLIWRPEFEFADRRTAIAHGWHRSFCLQGDTWFRGSVDHPGLMLALDLGGSCAGLAYRLPPDEIEKNLAAVMAREVLALPHPFPPRWIDIEMDGAAVPAITFVIDRNSANYAGHLTPEQVADVLAAASGSYGSMAQYLRNTVDGLEQLGIHDSQLWQLQELVADRIEAMPPRPPASLWRRLQTFLRRLRP